MRQAALDLAAPRRDRRGRDDFLMSASNAEAVRWLDRWPDWPGPVLLLFGPEGCGKTHLAEIWQQRAGARLVAGAELDEATVPDLLAAAAVAVDDADRAPPAALLHLYNGCVGGGRHLLLTARRAPVDWPAALPDLGSRLRATPAAALLPPDDALLAGLLVKHFAARQLRVRPAVIHYLVARMERSFAGAATLSAQLDTAGLDAGRAITVGLARRVLGETDQASSPPTERGDR